MINRVKFIWAKIHMFYLRYKYQKTIYKGSFVRRYLECEIFPYFKADVRFQRILLVGIAPFTRHYPEYFKNKEFIRTIDVNPDLAVYSPPDIHWVDSLVNIDKYIARDYLDVVFMNGVYGWGLNEENGLVISLEKIHQVMKREAVLLFGWNQMKEYDPLNIKEKDYFSKFRPYYFKGKPEIKLIRNNPKNHIFSFYSK